MVGRRNSAVARRDHCWSVGRRPAEPLVHPGGPPAASCHDPSNSFLSCLAARLAAAKKNPYMGREPGRQARKAVSPCRPLWRAGATPRPNSRPAALRRASIRRPPARLTSLPLGPHGRWHADRRSSRSRLRARPRSSARCNGLPALACRCGSPRCAPPRMGCSVVEGGEGGAPV
jgi:hypothetical protein